MLAVVVVAGLLPDTGVVGAAANCTYGKCPASQPFPVWAVATGVVIVIVALLAAALFLRRSRRRPPTQTGPSGAGDASAGAWAEGTTAPTPDWNEPPASELPPEADDGAAPPAGDEPAP